MFWKYFNHLLQIKFRNAYLLISMYNDQLEKVIDSVYTFEPYYYNVAGNDLCLEF